MKYVKFLLIAIFCLGLMDCSGNVKNKPRVIKTKQFNDITSFDDWYLAKQNNRCIIFSFPFSSTGKYLDRDAHYMAINYNPSTDSNELMILSGLPFKKGSKVRIHTNNKDFYLTTMGDKAWFFGNEDDLLQNMVLSQTDIIVMSEFEGGAVAIDKYSPKGLLNSFAKLNSSCISSTFS